MAFEFRAGDKSERLRQMKETIDRGCLDGLNFTLALNPDDGKGQLLPVEMYGPRPTWEVSVDLPRGAFWLRVAKA